MCLLCKMKGFVGGHLLVWFWISCHQKQQYFKLRSPWIWLCYPVSVLFLQIFWLLILKHFRSLLQCKPFFLRKRLERLFLDPWFGLSQQQISNNMIYNYIITYLWIIFCISCLLRDSFQIQLTAHIHCRNHIPFKNHYKTSGKSLHNHRLFRISVIVGQRFLEWDLAVRVIDGVALLGKCLFALAWGFVKISHHLEGQLLVYEGTALELIVWDILGELHVKECRPQILLILQTF